MPAPIEQVQDLLPGHPAIVITRGHLPHRARFHWCAETHTLVVADYLTPAGVLDALAEVLGVDLYQLAA